MCTARLLPVGGLHDRDPMDIEPPGQRPLLDREPPWQRPPDRDPKCTETPLPHTHTQTSWTETPLPGCRSPGQRPRPSLWTDRHLWKHNLRKLHLRVVKSRLIHLFQSSCRWWEWLHLSAGVCYIPRGGIHEAPPRQNTQDGQTTHDSGKHHPYIHFNINFLLLSSPENTSAWVKGSFNQKKRISGSVKLHIGDSLGKPLINLFIMADADIPENRRPKLWGGVSNLKFFHMININEMRAIFQFFHNGQLWYSISVDTQKTGDPNFGGGVSNLKFFRTININEMRAIFQFFHNGPLWYSISVDTRKMGDPNFGGQ